MNSTDGRNATSWRLTIRGLTPPARHPWRRILSGLALAAVLCWSGCASYQLGQQNLFRPDVRTVHVPVFNSESLRPNLGEQLTEAVIKELELRTPYQIARSAEADSVLSGRIVRESKRVLAQNQYSDARLYEAEFVVEMQWVNRRGEPLMQQTVVPLPTMSVTAGGAAAFIPEAGQSVAVAQQQAIQRVARQIVGQMESWW